MYTIAVFKVKVCGSQLLFLIIFLTTIISVVSNQSWSDKSNNQSISDLKSKQNCKILCGYCNCLSFYCGEECLCECNKENSEVDCIASIKNNSSEWQVPFAVLIQGPTNNQFIRYILNSEQHRDFGIWSTRSKRSTITIYMPTRKLRK